LALTRFSLTLGTIYPSASAENRASRALVLADALDRLDFTIFESVVGSGRAALAGARALRHLDEQGIDRLIAALGQAVRGLGQQGRRLQSGLVHREMALAGGGILAIIILLLAAR